MVNMDWMGISKRYNVMIEKDVEKYMAMLRIEAAKYHEFTLKVFDSLSDYSLRKGLRLASIHTIITYTGYDNEVDQNILRICSGIEMYRHCILLHDDIADREDLRRGGLAFQRMFDGFNEKFGESISIFSGNIAYSLALNAILSTDYSERKRIETLDILNDDFHSVNESQMLDLLFEYKNPSVEEWYLMARKRAASLFRTTVLIGSILGDAPVKDLPILDSAAQNIGFAFDIQDDIIDLFASKEQYGRDPGGDLVRGKKPLHIILAVNMAGEDLVELFNRVRIKGEISSNELETIRTRVSDCGALDKAKERTRFHIDEAQKYLGETSINDDSRRFFESMLRYISSSLDWYK